MRGLLGFAEHRERDRKSRLREGTLSCFVCMAKHCVPFLVGVLPCMASPLCTEPSGVVKQSGLLFSYNQG
jgi:hypothetical protein